MPVRLTNLLIVFLAGIGKLILFTYKTFNTFFTTKPSLKIILQHIYEIGIKTLPVLSVVCIFIGCNIAIVGYHIFKQFGGESMTGAFVSVTCVREMAPILVGSIMAAKPGTDISATIATMRVKEQIDALEVMSVDPFWFLIVPRIIAFIIVSPFLVIFADFISLSAGYFTSVFQLHISSGKFIDDMKNFLEVADFFKGMLKGIASSLIVCLISCFFGYNSSPGPKGVSKAINTSVVIASSIILVVNYFLTELLYGTK